MAKYVLAYHGGGGMPQSAEEQEKIMADWGAWFASLGDDVLDGGNPISTARTVTADGSVVDYTVEKTVKEGKNKGKVYTEQGNANLRYERMLVRKSKDENEASKILAGNALAGAADAPVASDAPDSPDDTVAA